MDCGRGAIFVVVTACAAPSPSGTLDERHPCTDGTLAVEGGASARLMIAYVEEGEPGLDDGAWRPMPMAV